MSNNFLIPYPLGTFALSLSVVFAYSIESQVGRSMRIPQHRANGSFSGVFTASLIGNNRTGYFTHTSAEFMTTVVTFLTADLVPIKNAGMHMTPAWTIGKRTNKLDSDQNSVPDPNAGRQFNDYAPFLTSAFYIGL